MSKPNSWQRRTIAAPRGRGCSHNSNVLRENEKLEKEQGLGKAKVGKSKLFSRKYHFKSLIAHTINWNDVGHLHYVGYILV